MDCLAAYQVAFYGYNTRGFISSESFVGSKLEAVTERALFSSRWILAPIFLGLSLALLALGVKFFQEAYHLIAEVLVKDEADLVLKVLALIDISLVGSLIVMVMFSGYENFVSTIDAKGTDTLGWLGKMDSGTLKLKVAVSIVAISSIHLLRVFMQVGNKGEGARKAVDEYFGHLGTFPLLHRIDYTARSFVKVPRGN